MFRWMQVAQFVVELIMQCFRDKRKVSAAEGQGKVDDLGTGLSPAAAVPPSLQRRRWATKQRSEVHWPPRIRSTDR